MRQTIVNEARKWIGIKFRHHGRNGQGVDCAGLLYVVYNKFGVVNDFIDYPSNPETGFVFRAIRNYADRILPSKAQSGDVVLLSFAGASTHFGILTDLGVIHADATLKRVVEHSISITEQGRAVAFFRMKGLQWLK